MLDFLWAMVVWLVQMVGTWVLAGTGLVLLFVRTSLSKFALARSFATAGLVLTLAYRYGFATEGLSFADGIIGKYLVMGAVATVVLLVLGAVYVAVGRLGARRARLRRLVVVRTAGSKIPGPLAVMLLLLATTGFLAWVMETVEEYENGFIRVMSYGIVLLPAGAFLLLVPFSVSGTVFNAANAHPALPSLAAPFVAGAAVVGDQFVCGVIATPENLKDPLALTGLAVVIVLSAVELVLLHRRGHGLTRDPEGETGDATGDSGAGAGTGVV
ncbi:hypothetical protein OG239_02600 [Streptomyces sp. NBC_00868]|uniref:hypothetical protein n=1 Tax=unclassified Streptomyces TaxID=2593676 RepID=UPI003250BCB4|nr:hypothetical protein OG239_02600 [Streptomyces sp. NBC_00868]